MKNRSFFYMPQMHHAGEKQSGKKDCGFRIPGCFGICRNLFCKDLLFRFAKRWLSGAHLPYPAWPSCPSTVFLGGQLAIHLRKERAACRFLRAISSLIEGNAIIIRFFLGIIQKNCSIFFWYCNFKFNPLKAADPMRKNQGWWARAAYAAKAYSEIFCSNYPPSLSLFLRR